MPGDIGAETSKTNGARGWGALLAAGWPAITSAQVASSGANTQTCAALLSNDSSVGARVGAGDSATRRDTTTRARADSVSFGVGGARTGNPTFYLFVGVIAAE